MATVVAQATGNFSAGATWTGGVKPQPGDTAQTGNFTVTIDENFTGTLNPTGSGYFLVNAGGITITGDLVMSSSYTGGGLRCYHASGNVTLNGVATGGAGATACGALNNGAGTLNVTTATGGAGPSAHGAYNNATGTLNVTTATGGAGSSTYGAYNNAAGTLNVTAATGGAGANAHGALNNGAGTLVCDLAVGSNWGVGGSGGLSFGVYGNGVAGQITKVKRIQFGPYGCTPVGGAVLIEADISNSAQFRTAYGGSTLTLVDAAASADLPAASNVRTGVSYDNGDKVGTCAVPTAAQTAYGVPVDNTTGTAVLTAAGVTAAVWDAARSGHATDGTFGATDEWAGNVDENAIATAAAAAILAAADSDPISANVTMQAGVLIPGPLALEATSQAILEDTGTTLPAAIAAASAAGSGAISFPVTINDEDSNPIDGVEVWISTDSAGTSVVAGTLSTDALGLATFMLDAGTYYLWRQRSGYNFVNPVTIVVS